MLSCQYGVKYLLYNSFKFGANHVHVCTPFVTYVIGDSFNDVSMFNITKNSFTFNRAEEEVKGYASELVDYVYEVVNKMI